MLWSQDCKQMTNLFEILKDAGVRDKVEKEKEEIRWGVNLGVLRGIR